MQCRSSHPKAKRVSETVDAMSNLLTQTFQSCVAISMMLLGVAGCGVTPTLSTSSSLSPALLEANCEGGSCSLLQCHINSAWSDRRSVLSDQQLVSSIRINRYVNEQMPANACHGSGNRRASECLDADGLNIAMRKRQVLRSLGLPPDALQYVVLVSSQQSSRFALAARTKDRLWLLDTRHRFSELCKY